MAVELLETLKEALTAYTGLSPNTFFTVLAAAIAVYYIFSVLRPGSSDHHQQHRSSSSKEDVQSRSMASTSSSRHSIPPSNSQSWRYDVFLSFRGDDTRNTFVDHLYTAIEQKGIQVYKDDVTLAWGETIGPSLLNAIGDSQIAVVVFSENYADSSWCLDEVAHIIECKDTRGQIVIPIFYHVNPSDVRKLKSKYGEAFSKHEGKNKHKVESWRKALERAGNLSGWVINDIQNSQEAKCIKDIVGAISGRLSLQITNVNKDLIGIETRLQDLKSKLEIGSDGVCIVGIWGVGGGGKTTLAYAACAEFNHRFEAHCFLPNIREESNKHGLVKLQKKLLSLVLNTKDIVVGSEEDGKIMITQRLRNKRVLVVLDDVDNVKQLKALAGSHDWFGEGSRIIITTRDEHLLTRHADVIYEVSLLSQDEAIKLFSKHAYREGNPVEDYGMLSRKVVDYAGGLPLALEILGSFLYDKDKDEWNDALAKLKHTPDFEVTERLKISYDGLESYQQKLFLDIACCMRGWSKDEAMRVLDACQLYPISGVKVLVQKSLIKVSDGKFDMHDLIEEMAHYIVRGEHPNNPEKHSRIWKLEDIIKLCSMGAAAPSMETEVLALPSDNYNHPRLAYVVANMKKLRWIKWVGYPASSFSSNFQPIELGCLSLIESHQKQLWEGYKHLPNLKILELVFLSYLSTTPDFNGLPRLERLILHSCPSLEEIHPSIGTHESLVYVKIEGCIKLETFPPIVWMKKLEALIFYDCDQLQQFPDIQSSMDSLVTLSLEWNNGIEVIPSSVGQFCTNLVSFVIVGCSKLKRIEGSFHLLKSLKNLDISGHYLDSSMSQKLPHELPRFVRKLNLTRCNLGNGDIPSNIRELLNLQILRLRYNKFSRLPSSLSRLPCLKLLDLSDCSRLVELPYLPSSIAILNAEGCISLERVGDLSDYKWLWKVSFGGCRKLIGGKIEWVLLSMLKRSALEDRFMSLQLPYFGVGRLPLGLICTRRRLVTSQLPHNWYNNFNGFLLCSNDYYPISIGIKQEMSNNSQPRHWVGEEEEEFDISGYRKVGYVPFSSLKKQEIPWWDPTTYIQNISLHKISWWDPTIYSKSNCFKAGVVRWKSNINMGDLKESPVSECWDEDDADDRSFKIKSDSKSSSIQIRWYHQGIKY